MSFALAATVAWPVGPPLGATAIPLQEALVALEAGELARARELLGRVLEQQPGNGLAHFHLGRLDLEEGDLELARGHLEIAVDGEFPRLFSAWYLLGRVRLLQREFEAAVEALDQSLRRAPRFAPARLDRARALVFLGRIEEGLAELLRAGASPSSAAEAGLLAAQLLIYLDRADDARATLRQRVVDSAVGAHRRKREAELLSQALAEDPRTEAKLRAALGEDLSLPGAYWALGVRQMRSGQTPQAESLFRIALETEIDNPTTALMLQRLQGSEVEVPLPAPPDPARLLAEAYVAWDDGRHEEAVQLAARLLERRPRLVAARLLLIRDAERRHDLWAALAGYQRLLDWLGSIPQLESGLAAVAQTMGAHQLAACAARRALVHLPTSGALHYLLAASLADLDQVEAAVSALQEAIDSGYGDVRVWLKLGELRFRQMRIADSLAAYRQAMEIDPTAAEDVRPFALSSLTTEQHQSLQRLLERHVQAHPENVNTLYSLAVMHLRSGRHGPAKDLLLRLAAIAPDHLQVHYNLGQIYLREGDAQRGQAEMQRFRELKVAEDEEWERHNRAHFRRLEARRAAAAGDPNRAVELYEQNVVEGTAELSDLLALAGACLEAGRPAAALTWFERILGFSPYDRDAWEGVAKAAERLGDVARLEASRRKLELLGWPCADAVSR